MNPLKYKFIILLLLITIRSFSQDKPSLTITIHLNDTIQTIRNIGASACWYGEEIGKTWPPAQKQQMAELLFSKEADNSGQPKGIGLSAFRYNIGAGTTEQGDSSGIRDPSHRVECFLSPDGKYDWSKQPGYTWLLQQAKNYGVENLIAFVNSPPVQFTKTGLGYKLDKDYTSNLKEDKYNDYANFLAEVIDHFDKSNLHFDFISPVNEPQWDWSGVKGQAKQEGSPYSNQEIYNTVKALNTSLSTKNLTTKILMTEAGMLDHLFTTDVKASRQVAAFWSPSSALYIGNLNHTTPFVEGHGYFTEKGDAYLIGARSKLRDTLKRYGPGLEYWQSEYCLLGDGFKEGATKNRISAIDCALFLAKVIHHDFTVGNATAWHYWNSFEPGPSDSNTRYNLIALNPRRATDTANRYTVTKNLWALGHYSLFVRPGMQRVQTSRDDGLNESAVAQDVMVSAFRDIKGKKLVVNVINYTTSTRNLNINVDGLIKSSKLRLIKHYQTSGAVGDDMKPHPVDRDSKVITLTARSIHTFIYSL